MIVRLPLTPVRPAVFYFCQSVAITLNSRGRTKNEARIWSSSDLGIEPFEHVGGGLAGGLRRQAHEHAVAVGGKAPGGWRHRI